MRVVDELRARGGVARWKDLVDAGIRTGAITGALARGEIVRPHRGCYALPGTPRQLVLEVLFRSQLTCLSWARAHGLPVLSGDHRTHVLVPKDRGVAPWGKRPGLEVAFHRDDDHRAWVPGSPGRWASTAVAHLDRAEACVSPIAHLAMVDAALGAGLLESRDLVAFTRGTLEHRAWLMTNAEPTAQSIGETVARVALREAGLQVVAQMEFAGVGRVDLVVANAIVVEVDGYAYHSGQLDFARDRERDRALQARGYRVLRFTHEEVLANPWRVVEDVQRVLELRLRSA